MIWLVRWWGRVPPTHPRNWKIQRYVKEWNGLFNKGYFLNRLCLNISLALIKKCPSLSLTHTHHIIYGGWIDGGGCSRDCWLDPVPSGEWIWCPRATPHWLEGISLCSTQLALRYLLLFGRADTILWGDHLGCNHTDASELTPFCHDWCVSCLKPITTHRCESLPPNVVTPLIEWISHHCSGRTGG